MAYRDRCDGLKEYLCYIERRLSCIKHQVIIVSPNQHKYYLAMKEDIKEYYKKHRLYGLYLSGKLDKETCIKFLGESERQLFRYISRQREKFIKYIAEKEVINFAKYPFSEGEAEKNIGAIKN